VLIIDKAEVQALLDLDRLVDALAAAMSDLSEGRLSMPGRMAALVPRRDAFLAAMVSYVPSLGALAAKLMSVFPENAGGPLPTHQGAILVFDPESGEPVALMDAAYITAVRTAAGSALATRLLARLDASTLAILGTGVQARAHARAIPRVRAIDDIRVAGRDAAKAAALAEELARDFGLPARPAGSYEDAVRGADIVCATTHSPVPVVRREWLAPGVHVNSVGYNPSGRELDDGTVVDSALVVESRAAALAPFPSGPNDLAWPIRDGLIDAEHVRAEIGELVNGTRPGRTGPGEITLYKSVGVAVQDAAAAALVLAAARERGVGRQVAI
jgi:ornithine cyclodeaminase/alanine dehydrogenase-like protein (mu-crystallin family)